MARTAFELTREEWQAYRPALPAQRGPKDEARFRRALRVAREAAAVLRRDFGATRVVLFGSLAHPEQFTPWSDIDLAAWGISPDRYYSAVAHVTGMSAEFKIDLLDPDSCRPALREVIEREGVAV